VALFHAGFLPKLAGHPQGLDTGLLPPGFLVLCPINFPMVNPAERDCKLVACFAAKRTRLHVSQVVRVRRFAATQQARLLGHKPQVVLVAVTARHPNREHTLVDLALGQVWVTWLMREDADSTFCRLALALFNRFYGNLTRQ
jgi:hypothetical protein